MENDTQTQNPGNTNGNRVALLISNNTLYEYSLFLKHLLVALADQSIPTAVLCPANCNAEQIAVPAVEIIHYSSQKIPFVHRRNLNMLTTNLSKFRPTVLHCLCEAKAPLARHLAKQLDLPYILTINSLSEYLPKLRISRNRLKALIVPARTIADDIAEAYPNLAEKTRLIRYGTFTKDNITCFDDPNTLPSIVLSNPINNSADFENFLNAAARLLGEYYEFMVVVTGKGPAESALRKCIRKKSLDQNVILVPGLESWNDAIAAADIYFQPITQRTFNPFMLEAMGTGTTIAACFGGVDDLIIKNETAVVFNPDDELDIYNTLKKLLDSRETARKLAENARQYAHENHSVSRMIEQLLQTYCISP